MRVLLTLILFLTVLVPPIAISALSLSEKITKSVNSRLFDFVHNNAVSAVAYTDTQSSPTNEIINWGKWLYMKSHAYFICLSPDR